MTLEFEQLPAVVPSYCRAVTRFGGSGLGKSGTVPNISARLRQLEVRADNLARYRKVCGFPRSETLPITYPHVLAFPLQMSVLTHKDFPLGLLGLIHVRNKITQYRSIAVDEPFGLVVAIGGHRDVAKGIEFDLNTRVVDGGGQTIWEQTGVMLSRRKHSGRSDGVNPNKSTPSELGFNPTEDATWQIPSDIGRRYAGVAGDYNPIHLSPWTAKLFGFPRAIATGMWVKARAAAALQPHLSEDAYTLAVAFKKPIFLPSTVVFRHAGAVNGMDFAITSRDAAVLHLTGDIQSPHRGE